MRDGEASRSRRVTFGHITQHQFLSDVEAHETDFSLVLLNSSPMHVAMSCRMFLDTKLHASVSKLPCSEGQTWRVAAVVFLDFIPLDIEFCTCEDPAGSASLKMKHASHSDAVRFKRVSELLVEFLRSSGLSVLAEHSCPFIGPPRQAVLIEDNFEDYLEYASEDAEEGSSFWQERVNLTLADFDSRSADLREAAIQSIARLAATVPASHLAFAEGLADRSERVAKVFFAKRQSPVSEMFPMAAALRRLACGESESQAVLRKSQFAKLITKYRRLIAGLPPLVAHELTLVELSMHEVSAEKRSAEIVPCLSNVSTRCTDIGSIQCFNDDSSAPIAWAAKGDSQIMVAQKDIAKIPRRLGHILDLTGSLFEPTQ